MSRDRLAHCTSLVFWGKTTPREYLGEVRRGFYSLSNRRGKGFIEAIRGRSRKISAYSVVSQRNEWVHTSRAASRYPTGQKRYSQQDDGCSHKREQVGRANAEEQVRE